MGQCDFINPQFMPQRFTDCDERDVLDQTGFKPPAFTNDVQHRSVDVRAPSTKQRFFDGRFRGCWSGCCLSHIWISTYWFFDAP
ncbi:hypothetical protein, partial [Novipirellula maiorica]|uniref:hypothetical protein n=1 Tax=Novipirellula maiorica TaxID=1265734 RepID=UPI001F35D321